jgi:hypothetical protein
MMRPAMAELSRRFPLPARLAAFAAALLAAGCSYVPYTTTPPKDLSEEVHQLYLNQKMREGPASDLVKPRIVSLCYGPAIDDLPELYDTILQACAGDYQRVIYYGQDAIATTCAVGQPFRHTFLCYDTQQRTLIPPIPETGREILPGPKG